MEIIQQKLIWIMGNAAALILLYKLKLGRIGIRRAPLLRMKIGVILLLWGSLLDIGIRTFLSGSGYSSSLVSFLFETVLGYAAGWIFIIWGLISWAVSHFDLRGKPLTTAGSRVVSDIILTSLTRGDSASLLFNTLSKDLFSILECQAVTFHGIDGDDRLRLALHRGMTEPSAKMLEYPRGNRNVFLLARSTRQAVISDENHTLHDYSFCETTKGVVSAMISVPVAYNGQIIGVLSAYRTKDVAFNEDDMKVLEVVAPGIAASVRREKFDKEYHQETRFKELLTVAARPLDSGQPMISALIKSAKIIYDYLPFKWISLYILGDGTPRNYEFNLPTGGAVRVLEGWYSKKDFPQLSNRDPFSGLKIGPDNTIENTGFIFPVGDSRSPSAHLEFEFKSPPPKSFMPLLGNMLGKRFAIYLKDDSSKTRMELYNSWSDSLQYFQRRLSEENDVTILLNEIASMIVDHAPASFCRIMLANPSRKFLKTAALAQKRELPWKSIFEPQISLEDIAYHRRALEAGATTIFNQADLTRRLADKESHKMIPAGTKCGLIIPLVIGQNPVGLMTVGDCRRAKRAFQNSDMQIFLEAVAGTISLILTWHKEKRVAVEGAKKLKIGKKKTIQKKKIAKPSTGINSRINGPLAGILAACEYLKSGLGTETGDFNRFLDSIERNASQIHQITSSRESDA